MPRAFWIRSMPRVTLPFREQKVWRFLRDQIRFVGMHDGLVEGHPSKRLARLNDFVEIAVLAFAQSDRFRGAQIVAHEFR